MKKLLLFFVVCLTTLFSGCKQSKEPARFVLAYVTAEGTSVPDTRLLTHINYAFGVVNKTFNGIDIKNPDRLRMLASLKRNAPHLKVLLSIGGWGSGRFSEMAADAKNRMDFAKDCKRIMDEFQLDGIDIDWEYPTCSGAGISSSPDDTDNYTLMMRDIRQTIGKDALLTLASVAGAQFIDFKGVLPYIDFVNIMTYAMNRPPYHHSALYHSEMSGELYSEGGVKAHLEKGIPADMLLLGVPFYGYGKKLLPSYIDYSEIIKLEGYETCWDSVACVPYLRDKEGDMVCTFDNPASLAIKCKYIKDMKLKGIMYWEYDADDKEGSLRKACYEGMQ